MEALIGRTVGQVLADYRMDYSALRLIDEPPGRLWGVELTVPQDGQPRRLFLEIEHSPSLFSETRTWPQALVEKQRVIKVHTSSDQLF